ncbi:MAG: phosphotriesterase family protein [Anaerolineaceae bacterium]
MRNLSIDSTQVHTVTGLISVEKLGITLFHEHLFLDNSPAFRPSNDPSLAYLREKKVSIEDLALLREYPYASLDNVCLNEVDTLSWELEQFSALGGRSVVEVTGWNSGRSPDQLRQLSQMTGIQIIMGCGLYRERNHPDWALEADEEEIAERIVREVHEGIPTADGLNVFPGVIGEIGVSNQFTLQEKKSLRAAAKAQVQTGLPLTIHLPGWERFGHSVLDLCEEQGVSPQSIVLDHIDPSSVDPEYQSSLAGRGAFLEFDGIGMGLFLYQEKQGPSDEAIAHAVTRLIDRGHQSQLLLSHDIYLKIFWRRYGGNGYSHVLRSFIPRLMQLGVAPSICKQILVDNPQCVFRNSASGTQLS